MHARLCNTLAACALFAVAVASDAQPVGTDFFVSVGHVSGTGAILRLKRDGRVRTIVATPMGQFAFSLVVDSDNRMLIASYPNGLVRIDPSTRGIVATIRPLWVGWILVDQNGDYLTTHDGTRGGLFRLARNGSAVTTLALIPNATALVEDRMSGDWVVGDVPGPPGRLVRIDRDGLRPPTTIPLPGLAGVPVALSQDPHRPNIYASGTPFFDYDPRTNAVAPLFGRYRSPLSCLIFDRAPDQTGAMIHGGTISFPTYVASFARDGTTLRLHPGVMGLAGFPYIHDVVLERSRNLAAILLAVPNRRMIRLSFASDAGKPYVLALGLSGYSPGTRLPDGRVVPLNADPLTALTAGGSVGSFLTGNAGSLNATGTAIVTFDVNSLGSAVTGVRVWAAAATFDPAAPLGISQISAPMLFVL